MGQEADGELKFLHDLDIGYENLHKNFEVSTTFTCSFTAHFSKVPKLYVVQLYYKYKSGQTLNGHYVGHDAGRDLIFLHDLDKYLKDSHNKFQLSTIFECRLMAYFRRKYIKTVQMCWKSALKMIQNCTKNS